MALYLCMDEIGVLFRSKVMRDDVLCGVGQNSRMGMSLVVQLLLLWI